MITLLFYHKIKFISILNWKNLNLLLGTRYRTVLSPKLADAFLMMYQTVAVGIFTNIGAFGGFCHGKPVSIERVQSADFGMEKARKRRIIGV